MNGQPHQRPDIVEISPAEVARFQAFMSLVATDSQVIWSRYYSFLTANAIVAVVIGALAAKPFSPETGTVLLVLSAFGLALSWQWKQITQRGWDLLHVWVKGAHAVSWESKPNPFDAYSEWCKTTGCGEGGSDWIATYALRVCHLFLIAYAGAGLAVFIKLII